MSVKTPNEIKEGLECCKGNQTCSLCPYYNDPTCEVLEDEALTYIQQLENQIGELAEKISQLEVAQPKWISVNERLPDAQTPVLTLGRRGSIGIGFTTTTSGVIDGHIYFYSRYGDSQPTHWMPLPMPPKEIDK